MRAWLVTWEWAGEYAAVDDPVAAILNPRWSDRRVLEYVEFLYANSRYSLSEWLGYANSRRFNRYPAYYGEYRGFPIADHIYCGHHPWLYARKVETLRVVNPNTEDEILEWDEIEMKLGTWANDLR